MTSEIINLQSADGPSADGISTGTSLLLPAVATSARLAHFPEEVYDLSAESHLVRLIKALIGDSGAGQLRKRITTARLQQTLQGAHFYDLDRFYGALFGVRRAPEETLLVDPYQSTATSAEWSVQTARDASYRSRVTQLARALQHGPTPTGIELAAEALLSVDCDVFESYIQADGSFMTYGELEALYGESWVPSDTPGGGTYEAMEGVSYADLEGASLGRMSGDNRKVFTVRPKRRITQSEAYELGRVLDRIKPVDARWVIDTTGSDPYLEVPLRAAMADSVFWEVLSLVSTRVQDASSPYQINSAIPVEQPRPPFTAYQGEAWSYIADVIGVAAFEGDSSIATIPQVVTQADGTALIYQAIAAITPRRYVLAGRAASDGILTSNPAWGASPGTSGGSLSPLLVDGMNLTALNDWFKGNPADALPQNPGGRFWATSARRKDDPSADRLVINFTQPRLMNYISVETARYPHVLTVEYWDGNRWVRAASRDVFESVPQFIPPGRTVEGHPHHNFASHWAHQSIKFDAPVETNSVRFSLTRLASGTAPRSDATNEIAYSLALRSIDVGYRVSSLADVPAAALDGSQPIGTAVDMLGSPVDYVLHREHASHALLSGSDGIRWLSEPQPVNYAVVNFFLDVRDATGDSQVIDRLFLHPTHPGASMSIYTTEAVWSGEGSPDDAWLALQPWRPVPREFRLQKGYVYLPPTAARFFKLEFTALTPEQMETFLPIARQVRLFPRRLVDALSAQTAGDEVLPSGVSTAMQIGDADAYADALTTLRIQTYDQTTYDPVEALYADNPALAARLRATSWVYGFTPWHQGSQAPRFSRTEVHDYEVVEVTQQSKIGFFVGLYSIKAFTADVGANDDTHIYEEPFHNFRNIEEGFTWNFAPHAVQTGVLSAPVVMHSKVHGSLHNVASLQFATQQTEPVQVIPDDDFRDPALASIDWRNHPDGWHQFGDSVVVYSPQNHAARIVRYATPMLVSNPRSPSLVQSPTHPVFASRASTWQVPYPPTEGGIESPLVGVSGAREIYVAVRLTFLTAATSPAIVQIVKGGDGTVLKEFSVLGLPSEAVERYFQVDPGAEESVRVRVVQRGISNDIIEVDRLSLFDVGITWEFSVNGGEDWVKVKSGVRNNAHGVVNFPEPGNQLCWRVTGHRSFMTLNALRIRPLYVGVQNARDNGEQRGANVSAYDAAVPITEDPMFTTWSEPIPRAWFLAYRRLPSLVSVTGPAETEFARFYGRPITDAFPDVTDTTQRRVVADRPVLDFARSGDLTPEESARDSADRKVLLYRSAAESVEVPVEQIISLKILASGHALVNRLPHLT